MPRKIDITGKKFGQLTALHALYSNQNRQMLWAFKCSCGNRVRKEAREATAAVRKGRNISCGCHTKVLHHKANGRRWVKLSTGESMPVEDYAAVRNYSVSGMHSRLLDGKENVADVFWAYK